MTETVAVFAEPSPVVRRVPIDRPWAWLAAGWQDLRQAAAVSLAYGLGIILASALLLLMLVAGGRSALILPLGAGFLLVAPLLAAGLYETSRRLRAGLPVSLAAALAGFRANASQIGLMGLLLLLLHLAWLRIAFLLFALLVGDSPADLDRVVTEVLLTRRGLPLLVVGTAVGGVLAVVTFVISAVSIPMLLDRDVNVFTAVATSFVAVRANPATMALWAAIIAACTIFGLATLTLGLAIVLPLLGHASWHAYRDLVA